MSTALRPLRQIIWDWNGTLLDDAAYCLHLTDGLLRQHRLMPMETLEVYREKFGFPVIDYYASIGFGNDIFPTVAVQWMDGYMKDEASIPLQSDAIDVSERFRQAGLHQVIISASKLENLQRQLDSRPYFGFFDDPCGLNDIYAGSKVDIAKKWMQDHAVRPDETLLIGDTLHDLEVARAIGCTCMLVENGHQSKRRLNEAGADTAPCLSAIADRILS